jgi:hypothetical protein
LRQDYPPKLLLIAHIHIILELLLGTQVPVYAFIDQDGLYRGITEDHTGGEEAVDDSEEDLDCAELAFIREKRASFTYTVASISGPRTRLS